MISKITLRELRLMKEKSQQEVADYLGVERTTYSNWEKTGKYEFSIVLKLCEFYNVDISMIQP